MSCTTRHVLQKMKINFKSEFKNMLTEEVYLSNCMYEMYF